MHCRNLANEHQICQGHGSHQFCNWNKIPILVLGIVILQCSTCLAVAWKWQWEVPHDDQQIGLNADRCMKLMDWKIDLVLNSWFNHYVCVLGDGAKHNNQTTKFKDFPFCFLSWCLTESAARTNKKKLFPVCLQATARNNSNKLLRISCSFLFSMILHLAPFASSSHWVFGFLLCESSVKMHSLFVSLDIFDQDHPSWQLVEVKPTWWCSLFF